MLHRYWCWLKDSGFIVFDPGFFRPGRQSPRSFICWRNLHVRAFLAFVILVLMHVRCRFVLPYFILCFGLNRNARPTLGARREEGWAQKEKGRPRPTRAREGSNDVRATVSGFFYWGVLVKGLHTAGGTPRLPPQPRRPLRHGDPRRHLSITGYRGGRDSVGRPALFGCSDGAPEGRSI